MKEILNLELLVTKLVAVHNNLLEVLTPNSKQLLKFTVALIIIIIIIIKATTLHFDQSRF